MKLYGHHWHPSGSPSPRLHLECSYTAMRIYFPKPRAAPFLSAEQPSGLTNTDAPEPTHRQLRPDPAGSPCPRPHTQSAGCAGHRLSQPPFQAPGAEPPPHRGPGTARAPRIRAAPGAFSPLQPLAAWSVGLDLRAPHLSSHLSLL